MVYKAIGAMSGSSLDGLDIAFVQLQENGGKWSYEILHAQCYEYEEAWKIKLKDAINLNALEYQLLHSEYGHYIGKKINAFIDLNKLQHQVNLISSHGHTTFHEPKQKLTGQLGNGAGIAAETNLPVVTDLRAVDVAFGGEGAPIVPIGERLLLGGYEYFLNLGGIANISFAKENQYIAFDVCAANRVLNMLAQEKGLEFDEDGRLAAAGKINDDLLNQLNTLEYYQQPYPKSLANSFGTDIVYPLVKNYPLSTEDSIRTYVEHIIIQVKDAIVKDSLPVAGSRLLATGGGALNSFLMNRLKEHLNEIKINVEVPEENLIKYKEALIMALMGVLRWREEYNVLASVTGAKRNTINGALWLGTEA